MNVEKHGLIISIRNAVSTSDLHTIRIDNPDDLIAIGYRCDPEFVKYVVNEDQAGIWVKGGWPAVKKMRDDRKLRMDKFAEVAGNLGQIICQRIEKSEGWYMSVQRDIDLEEG